MFASLLAACGSGNLSRFHRTHVKTKLSRTFESLKAAVVKKPTLLLPTRRAATAHSSSVSHTSGETLSRRSIKGSSHNILAVVVCANTLDTRNCCIPRSLQWVPHGSVAPSRGCHASSPGSIYLIPSRLRAWLYQIWCDPSVHIYHFSLRVMCESFQLTSREGLCSPACISLLLALETTAHRFFVQPVLSQVSSVRCESEWYLLSPSSRSQPFNQKRIQQYL